MKLTKKLLKEMVQKELDEASRSKGEEFGSSQLGTSSGGLRRGAKGPTGTGFIGSRAGPDMEKIRKEKEATAKRDRAASIARTRRLDKEIQKLDAEIEADRKRFAQKEKRQQEEMLQSSVDRVNYMEQNFGKQLRSLANRHELFGDDSYFVEQLIDGGSNVIRSAAEQEGFKAVAGEGALALDRAATHKASRMHPAQVDLVISAMEMRLAIEDWERTGGRDFATNSKTFKKIDLITQDMFRAVKESSAVKRGFFKKLANFALGTGTFKESINMSTDDLRAIVQEELEAVVRKNK